MFLFQLWFKLTLFQPHIERLPSREPCRYFNSDCGLRNGIHLIMELD